jgi:hypothetical protein
MSLTNTYLVTTRNLEAFLNALQTAQAPERFTTKFLQDLEFSSSNDRLFIGLLKGLGFIDESGAPQQRYFDFLDQTQARQVLAQAIREAYDDLFRINKDAHTLSEEEIKNKLKTLTRGEKSDKVVGLMAKTFKALSDYADWSKPSKAPPDPESKVETVAPKEMTKQRAEAPPPKTLGLHYDIQIHLPATRDSAVYDAIFKSLKDHLL